MPCRLRRAFSIFGAIIVLIKVLIPDKEFLPYYKSRGTKSEGVVPYIGEEIEEILRVPVRYVLSKDEALTFLNQLFFVSLIYQLIL